MRKRLLRGQDGFSLAEMMVTIVIMIVVLFALYSIFDTSIRVFKFGNDKVEAVENARLGLAKMEREIRATYPVNGLTGVPRYRFFTTNGTALTSPPQVVWPNSTMSTQITFGNELNNTLQTSGNGKIDCNPGSVTVSTADDTPCEYITYKLSSSGSTRTLLRNKSVSGSTSSSGDQPVVEFVKPNGLQFRYFTAGGTVIAPASPGTYTQADIARVEISLQIIKDKVTQTLTTEVDLRNPGSISP